MHSRPERHGRHMHVPLGLIMKRLIILGFLIVLANFAFGQNKSESPIIIGKSVELYSKFLKENRTLLFHRTDIQKGITHTKTPTIYVLDGDEHFRYLVGLLHRMGGDFVPKMNIVAITQNDRQKDLDPKNYNNFFSYISEEVIPLSDSIFGASDERILIGHSAAGLFAMNLFVNNNELFQHYLVIDPWMIGQEISRKLQSKFDSSSIENKSVFVTMARTFPDSIAYDEIKTDTSKNTEMAREIHSVIVTLQHHLNELQFGYKYFDKESHMSVPNISMYYGIRFFFQNYSNN